MVYRSDESGTTDNFQRYLDAASNGAWGKGAGKTFHGGVGQGAPGNEGTSAMVKNTEGAITYNEWSFAQGQRLFAAKIVTSAGPHPVAINADTVGKAIAGATIAGQGNDLVLNISSFYKPTQPGAYPIVLATYELVCSKYADAADRDGGAGVSAVHRRARPGRPAKTTDTSRCPTSSSRRCSAPSTPSAETSHSSPNPSGAALHRHRSTHDTLRSQTRMTARHIVAIGGSDAGISAALRARELDPTTDVTVVVADAYPNFSICGIPYYVSGEVTHWTNLAHRTAADLAATGMRVLTDTRATGINVEEHTLDVLDSTGAPQQLSYDALIVGTGAISARPPIRGLSGPDALGPADGVHLLHSMGDTFAVMDSLQQRNPATAVIVGAGYIGLEMAEALTARGIHVTQIEALPEVLPTVDPELGALVHAELERHGVEVLTHTAVTAITRTDTGALTVTASRDDQPVSRTVDFVLVVVGVRPDTELAADAGAHLGVKGAIAVDEAMRTNLPDVFAAGDCVHTHHRLLGITWLPLGTTAHKQGRVAGENALGGNAHFAGSLGTQVVKVFDLVAARTGLREHEALAANRGWTPVTSQSSPDDHKAYYPGATPIHIRITGDQHSGRLLGAQLVGHRSAEIAKRVDTYATALFHEMTVDGLSELDLSYTPPLGSPWDATQMAAQAWVRRTPARHNPIPNQLANVRTESSPTRAHQEVQSITTLAAAPGPR